MFKYSPGGRFGPIADRGAAGEAADLPSKRTWLSMLNTRRLSRGVFRDGFVYLDEQNHSDLAARRQQGFLILSCGVISFSQFPYNAALRSTVFMSGGSSYKRNAVLF
ncbi:MAG: hypothetical protein E5X58_25825 [Mesorhizobium sp.]|nr:MAG: hypothetical protein E5X58_25825 [Mesorhizobium sp.]